MFRYALPSCDVPPHNAVALTASPPCAEQSNRPSQCLSDGCHFSPFLQSPSKRSPANSNSKACWSGADPAPTGGCRLRGVFTSDAEVSRSFTAAEAAWRASSWWKRGRPVATAAKTWCKRLSHFNPPSWSFLEDLKGCPRTQLVVWIGCQELSFPPIQLLGVANVSPPPEGAVTCSLAADSTRLGHYFSELSNRFLPPNTQQMFLDAFKH